MCEHDWSEKKGRNWSLLQFVKRVLLSRWWYRWTVYLDLQGGASMKKCSNILWWSISSLWMICCQGKTTSTSCTGWWSMESGSSACTTNTTVHDSAASGSSGWSLKKSKRDAALQRRVQAARSLKLRGRLDQVFPLAPSCFSIQEYPSFCSSPE